MADGGAKISVRNGRLVDPANEIDAETDLHIADGRVAAGAPVLAEENIEGRLAVDEMIARNEECFALRVNGDSMKNAGIIDGDVVIVSPQPDAKNGDIVVELLDEEATVKTYMASKGKVILRPENPDYDDIVLDKRGSVRVLGKVVGLMRRFQ